MDEERIVRVWLRGFFFLLFCEGGGICDAMRMLCHTIPISSYLVFYIYVRSTRSINRLTDFCGVFACVLYTLLSLSLFLTYSLLSYLPESRVRDLIYRVHIHGICLRESVGIRWASRRRVMVRGIVRCMEEDCGLTFGFEGKGEIVWVRRSGEIGWRVSKREEEVIEFVFDEVEWDVVRLTGLI